MYALTWFHDEERSHEGVSLLAVSESIELLEDRAAEFEAEKALEEQEPASELAWADWGAFGQTESVAVVAWGRYTITEVEQLG